TARSSPTSRPCSGAWGRRPGAPGGTRRSWPGGRWGRSSPTVASSATPGAPTRSGRSASASCSIWSPPAASRPPRPRTCWPRCAPRRRRRPGGSGARAWPGAPPAAGVVERKGRAETADSGELEAVVQRVVAATPDLADKFRGGKRGVLGALVGQVMREPRGRANPKLVSDLLERAIGGWATTADPGVYAGG